MNMRNKNLFKKLLAAALIVAMAIPAVYLGAAKDVKAVDADVLKVIAQTTQSVVTDEESDYNGKYVLRFTSTVAAEDLDAVDYVGFEVTDGTNTYRSATTSVFTRIDSSTKGAEFTYSPKVVDMDSAYFFTAKWEVATDKTDTVYRVRAFAVNKGSDAYVYGPERCISVDDGLSSSTTALVSFAAAEEVTTAYVGGAAVEIAGQGNGYVHVRVPKTGLKSVNSLTLTSDEAGENKINDTVYRYFGNAVYNGTPDTSWYDVNPDASTFVIATTADLWGFATLKTDFNGKTVYLASDIKLNNGNANDWAAGNVDGVANWTSIYKKTPSDADAWSGNGWKGTFDGQGHTISGMYVPSSNVHGGLFYALDKEATIQNLKVVNSYVTGGYVGTLAATSASNIKNIYSDAIVVSSKSLGGGLVGERNAVPETNSVENCWFAGSVTSTGDFAGGIVGKTYNGTIKYEDCLVTGSITGNKYVGGIAGQLDYGTIVLSNCVVTTLDINGGSYRGVMLGYKNGGTATITACVGLGKACNNLTVDTGFTQVKSAQLTGTKAYDLLADYDLYKETNANAVWTLTNGYPAISYWVNANDRIDATGLIAEEVQSQKTTYTADTAWYTANPDANEFVINTADELYGLSTLTSQGANTFAGKTIKLGRDIVLNEGKASDWLNNVKTLALKIWTPISLGTWSNKDTAFAGTFDGQGYTISGMYMPQGTPGELGLFTSVAPGGTVKNLRLVNSYVYATNAGSVVAQLQGNLFNIYSDAIVRGGNVGGMVSEMRNDKSDVDQYVEQCWFAGSVEGKSSQVGGIIAYASAGYNKKYTIKDCLVTGTVKNNTNAAGGIMAFFNAGDETIIENCLVFSPSITGGTTGAITSKKVASNSKTIQNNFGTFGQSDAENGYTVCEAAALTGTAALDVIGATYSIYSESNPDGIWAITSGYPALAYWVNR